MLIPLLFLKEKAFVLTFLMLIQIAARTMQHLLETGEPVVMYSGNLLT